MFYFYDVHGSNIILSRGGMEISTVQGSRMISMYSGGGGGGGSTRCFLKIGDSEGENWPALVPKK